MKRYILFFLIAVQFSAGFAYAETFEIPSDRSEIIDALAMDADAGDTLLVSNRDPFNASVAYKPFTMESGVKILADPNATPIIDGADSVSYAVEWPATSSSTTILRGFTVRGGTNATVRVRDQGVIESCVVEKTSAPSGFSGIRSIGSTTIDLCSVSLAGSYTNYIGIYQTDGTPFITSSTVYADDGYGISVDCPSATTGGTVSDCSITMDVGTAVYISKGSPTTEGLTIDFDTSDFDNIGIQAGYSVGLARGHIQDCLISAPGGVGVYIYDDSAKVHNNTIDDVGAGVVAYSGATVTVWNCIVTNYDDGTDYAYENAIAEYCIADGSDPYDTGSQGTGSVNEDPLYCDASEGEYTLRIDSYGNPENNASGQLVGAFPVVCMYGTLARSTTFPGNSGVSTLTVLGDTKIPSTKTLTLDDDATILVSDDDDHPISGYDADKVTLIVDGGNLYATGSSGHLAALKSAVDDENEGDWVGVCVESGILDLDYASIKNAEIGVQANISSGTLTIENSSFAYNETTDIDITYSAENYLSLADNTITVGYGTGISVDAGALAFLSMDGNTVTGTGSSTRGILLTGTGSGLYPKSENPHTVTNNVVSGFSGGEAMKVSVADTVEFAGNVFQNSSTGILADKSSGSAMEIRIGISGSSENIISGNFSGITTTGASCNPNIRYNYIYSNTVGILSKSGANPNIGDSSVDGNNNITNNSSYCIRNEDGSLTVSAIGNYFGNPGGCPLPSCKSGNVDISGWLCTNPLGFYVPIMPTSRDPLEILGVFPSPVMQSRGLEIKLYAETERDVTVGVFDVAGRLVRDLGVHRFAGGWEVKWDGRDARGIPVTSGVYFASAKADRGLNDVVKFVVVN